jgi:hypothetical protein
MLVPMPCMLRLMSSRSSERGAWEMARLALGIALLFLAVPTLAAQGGRRSDRRSPEQRKAESIAEVSQRLGRLSSRPNLSQENRTLAQKVTSLLDRSRQAAAGSYLFECLESAMDDLLDASDEILESRLDVQPGGRGRNRNQSIEEDRQDTARDLERSYFRIQQGDYFARQSQETDGQDYVVLARRLYQLARAAYDNADYAAASDLADASRKVIDGLESLAQAAVPIPEPPQLPEA